MMDKDGAMVHVRSRSSGPKTQQWDWPLGPPPVSVAAEDSHAQFQRPSGAPHG